MLLVPASEPQHKSDAGVRVVIADDQRIVREGLATIVSSIKGFEVVGLASDGGEAISLVGELAPTQC